jgi:hypothetical protein
VDVRIRPAWLRGVVLESARQASASGQIVRKVSSATADNSTLLAHRDADGQAVAQEDWFNVGTYDTPYPGFWGLPAHERVNCRCGMFLQQV